MTRIKKNLKATQDRQKSYADNNRNETQFAVGDHVFLKIKPRKNSSNLGNCSKLATKYCEPFEILNRVGPVAYELALPTSIKVHNIFHVSLLKTIYTRGKTCDRLEYHIGECLFVFMLQLID